MPFLETFRQWNVSPNTFVRECLGATPDDWQEKALVSYAAHNWTSITGCMGCGKTTVLAWLALHFLITRLDGRIAVTSATLKSLEDNLWHDVLMWIDRSNFLKNNLFIQSQNIIRYGENHMSVISKRNWNGTKEHQMAVFSSFFGSDHCLYIADEAENVPKSVLTSTYRRIPECKYLIAGSPSRAGGALYEAKLDKKWQHINVTGDPDAPNRSPRVQIDWAQQMIERYGRDNAWVRAKVLGEWPFNINAPATSFQPQTA